jgi:tetratricopeptide (TPR) repeat protein
VDGRHTGIDNRDVDTDPRSLLDLYESGGGEDAYARAKPLYEQAIAACPDPVLIRDYGYLLECHGRRALGHAVEQYEQALALDPEADKVRYQKISAQAALGEIEEEIRDYTARLAAAPDDLRQYRYLARAHLAARRYDKTREVVDAGLALASQDRVLIECRGDVRAATGDTAGALADWHHGLDLDPEDISPLYSSAFLHEREGRHHSDRSMGSHPELGSGPRLPPRRGVARAGTTPARRTGAVSPVGWGCRHGYGCRPGRSPRIPATRRADPRPDRSQRHPRS